jgi:hypothetical protein
LPSVSATLPTASPLEPGGDGAAHPLGMGLRPCRCLLAFADGACCTGHVLRVRSACCKGACCKGGRFSIRAGYCRPFLGCGAVLGRSTRSPWSSDAAHGEVQGWSTLEHAQRWSTPVQPWSTPADPQGGPRRSPAARSPASPSPARGGPPGDLPVQVHGLPPSPADPPLPTPGSPWAVDGAPRARPSREGLRRSPPRTSLVLLKPSAPKGRDFSCLAEKTSVVMSCTPKPPLTKP